MPISPESDYCLMGMVSMLEATVDIDTGARRMGLDVDSIIDVLENRQNRWRTTATSTTGTNIFLNNSVVTSANASTAPTATTYTSGTPVAAFLRRAHALPEGLEWTHGFAKIVTRLVLDWYETDQPSDMDRAIMAYDTLLNSRVQFDEAVLHVAGVLADGHLAALGEETPEFLRHAKKDGTPDLLIADFETLTSRETVERAFAVPDVRNWFDLLSLCEPRIARGVTAIKPEAFFQHMEETLRQAEEQQRRAVSQARRHRSIDVGLQDRRKVRHARRALRRGVQLYSNLFGQEGIHAFLSGKELVVQGRLYDYRLIKTLDVVWHSMNPKGHHIPYSLSICDKVSGKEITSGCVYFENTPIIDQIIALSLHVRDREDEVELLRKTNMTHTRALFEDDFLRELKGLAPRKADAPPSRATLPEWTTRDGRDGYLSRRSDLIDRLRPIVWEVMPNVVPLHPLTYGAMANPHNREWVTNPSMLPMTVRLAA